MKYGPERLINDLRELGYQVELVAGKNDQQFAVISDFVVPLGHFEGCKIDLGLPATKDFPNTVGSSIHIRCAPQLYEITDSVPSVRNIKESDLGGEWRYWSINFGWSEERTARRLISQINGVFERA